MTEREKIAQIIAEHLCSQGKSHKRLYGSERMCYSRDNFAECEKVSKCVDALIAAKIGDVKDLQAQVDALEITNIALQAGYDGAEKNRLYWVNKYKEAEHRAEIAERALLNACFVLARNYYTDGGDWVRFRDEFVAYYKKQAEKELAEERKDEN